MVIPRPEHPRPQSVRPDWLCLNGEWEFEIDGGDSGAERGLVGRPLQERITVPFCPESALSGIGRTDFLNAVWYRRRVAVPSEWSGRRVLLHFQAVDYDATVWVDGVEVARHRGGHTPFTADITDEAPPGSEVDLVVRARDDHRAVQPQGKQSAHYANHDCHYTRTSGIWQTVWLEPVPPSYLGRPRLTPDVSARRLSVELPVRGPRHGLTVRAVLRDERGEVAAAERALTGSFQPTLHVDVPADRLRLWSPDDPHLYDLELLLVDSAGATVDAVASYAGLRSIEIDGAAVLLNGRPVFQRLVLDQGWYPDGLMTAPDDAALVEDIELALAAGFNGARLHQKVFEERFLHHADRLGYLVWGEFPDWGAAAAGPDGKSFSPTVVGQWLEALERDYSHPSIVGWCALNETFQERRDAIEPLDDVTRACFLAAKAMDRTRPVLDVSGASHRVPESDVWDSHDYDQDPVTFAERHAATASGAPYANSFGDAEWSVPYAGQPVFVSEFGGIWWSSDVRPDRASSWGYGSPAATREEVLERFAGLCAALLDNPGMFGYCYTQLTDVFQEQNGIYTFDRKPKLDMDVVRAAQLRTAAVERE